MFCREQAARFSPYLDAFSQAGVRLAAIGSGSAQMAAAFVESHNVEFPVYCDPTKKTYAAFGMHRTLGLGLRSASFALRALRAGHLQGRVAGDPWQQGGAVLLGADGREIWKQQHKVAGEPIDIRGLLELIEREGPFLGTGDAAGLNCP